LGNFSNRILKFLDASFAGVIPAYGAQTFDAEDEKFIEELH